MKPKSIVVTLDLDPMRKVADTVLSLYKGEAIYFGPVADLDKSDNAHVKLFLAMDDVQIHGKVEDV